MSAKARLEKLENSAPVTEFEVWHSQGSDFTLYKQAVGDMVLTLAEPKQRTPSNVRLILIDYVDESPIESSDVFSHCFGNGNRFSPT